MSTLFLIRFRDPAATRPGVKKAGRDKVVGDNAGRDKPGRDKPGRDKAGRDKAVGDYLAGPENALLQTVANELLAPVQHYNPIFIHGPTGVGKSHLLRGLVDNYLATHPRGKAQLIGGADFARSIASAVEVGSVDDTREAYRANDLFACDDLQELATKPHAQQELLQTLDALLQRRARVLLASRVAPGELNFLAGLKSRIQWGLTVPVQAPCAETARQLVEHLARELDLQLTPDAIAAIASPPGKNGTRLVPELRGLLMQLRQVAGVASEPIDGTRIARILDHTQVTPVVPPRTIIQRTARHFGLKMDDLIGPSRRQTTVQARGTAIYLIRHLTGSSFQQIGRLFGNRDHTTVLHAYRRIEASLNDAMLQLAVREISARLGIPEALAAAIASPGEPNGTPGTSKFARRVRGGAPRE